MIVLKLETGRKGRTRNQYNQERGDNANDVLIQAHIIARTFFHTHKLMGAKIPHYAARKKVKAEITSQAITMCYGAFSASRH
ncbi:MAG: DUF3703 domain-containing protein [Rhodospirillaceae bacterium]|nr:DUF3703 domain-containing protein [Rhodospirillaceae bacterium]MBT4218412.1 DUF3703 domain-containing protein [Rhodospirillaceae bacterium]MBT4464435.1 DUF3703 domain-containing protein [Rhodospirillaceae bacterium]MBT5014447.1 DUF3703 domain-containing protein [Rhodospirillaceae bacterium]MBT5308387.1 DUF3703 domain-containing protein [Rhodospirillaceae bacterium]